MMKRLPLNFLMSLGWPTRTSITILSYHWRAHHHGRLCPYQTVGVPADTLVIIPTWRINKQPMITITHLHQKAAIENAQNLMEQKKRVVSIFRWFHFRFPQLTYGKIPCKNFALIGHECTHSGCTFRHSVFPGNFNRDDQTTLAK